MKTELSYRIKVGVTGNRKDLPETSLLKDKIREVIGFNEWQNGKTVKENSIFSMIDSSSIGLLKNAVSTPVSFSILTALAEGADRIVADVILEMEGSKIEVILPFNKEDYLEDFEATESKNDFEKLLRKDFFPRTLRNKKLKEEWSDVEIPEEKKRLYFNAGKYIVENCDVLIAVWDGKENVGQGGTFDVIEYARKLKKPIIKIITTKVLTIEPEFKGNGSLPGIEQFDHFNSFKVAEKIIDGYVRNIYKDCFDESNFNQSKSLDEQKKELLKSHLFPYYAKASLIAKGYKNRFKLTGLLAYILSSLAVLMLSISIILNVFTSGVYYVEFILLSAIFFAITIAHKKNVHSGWLLYRFLTERIRVAPYFFLAGREVGGTKIFSGRNSKREEFDGTYLLFGEIWYQLNYAYRIGKGNVSGSFDKNLVDYIAKSWIKGQVAFQEKYFKRNNSKNNFFEKSGKWIFAFAILSALTHIVLSYCHDESYHLLHQLLTVLALWLPALAATFEGIRRQNEYSRNKNRSNGMISQLTLLAVRFTNAPDEQEFYTLLNEADMLTMNETQEWQTLMIPSELEYVT